VVPSGVADVTPLEPRRRRHVVTIAVAVVVAIAAALLVAARWPEGDDGVAATTTTTLPPPTTTSIAYEVPPVTEVATPATRTGDMPVFDAPNGTQVGSAGFWYGYPMTLPVLDKQGDWLLVRLPERPNGKTGWVRAADVTMGSTPYRIVIRLSETRLYVYKDGFEAFSMPAGLGKSSTPTPPGSFFVAINSQPGPHGYGPVVLDTSGHSEAIESFQGLGDAIISIHGPISAASDAQIGTTGTYISNGCVRLHEADQLKLAPIPLGTPVDIVA
jgi:lipoprotein-anchoring transpeptidase ErfK/SrfK